MNKKIIGIILILLIICITGLIIYPKLTNKTANKETTSNNSNNSTNTNEEENTDTPNNSNKKILVVYFSATNNTKNVAETLANNLNGDIFEIEPKEEYTSEDLDWTDNNSRVSKEHDNENLRNIELKINIPDNWENYDTILIGYPIWWGIAAWPVNTFVKSNDFNSKTIYPFCTSASSGLGQSDKLLENIANGGNWQEGQRFTSNPSNSDIKEFTDRIK